MFKWLATLLVFLFPLNNMDNGDYVGQVAAEAAYSGMLTSAGPSKPKVPTKDCTTCNGTGRIRSGDNLVWIKCPDCDGSLYVPPQDKPTPAPLDEAEVKTPKSEPERYSPKTQPAPTVLIR